MTPEQAFQVLQRQALRASGTFDEHRMWEAERPVAMQALAAALAQLQAQQKSVPSENTTTRE